MTSSAIRLLSQCLFNQKTLCIIHYMKKLKLVMYTELSAISTCKSRTENSNSDGSEPNERVLLNLRENKWHEKVNTGSKTNSMILVTSCRQPYLNFSGLCRFPLDKCDAPTQNEDGEPLQLAERAVQHEDGTQGRARDLQLIGHLNRKTQAMCFISKQ